MPLYEYLCSDCGETSELLIRDPADVPQCLACRSKSMKKLLSAHSSYSGATKAAASGLGDTACCGGDPSTTGCSGHGSCCGKNHSC